MVLLLHLRFWGVGGCSVIGEAVNSSVNVGGNVVVEDGPFVGVVFGSVV